MPRWNWVLLKSISEIESSDAFAACRTLLCVKLQLWINKPFSKDMQDILGVIRYWIFSSRKTTHAEPTNYFIVSLLIPRFSIQHSITSLAQAVAQIWSATFIHYIELSLDKCRKSLTFLIGREDSDLRALKTTARMYVANAFIWEYVNKHTWGIQRVLICPIL